MGRNVHDQEEWERALEFADEVCAAAGVLRARLIRLDEKMRCLVEGLK